MCQKKPPPINIDMSNKKSAPRGKILSFFPWLEPKHVIYAEQIYEKARGREREESRGEEIKPNGDAVRFNGPL